MRLCRLCNERTVAPAREKAYDYRCSRCRSRTPAHRAAMRNYMRSERGQAVRKNDNDRRIWIGKQHHSRAATPDVARAINLHIKERISVAKQRFAAGAKTEGDPAG
jgi:hypothetical protein